jgi:hypothetical protein
VAASIASRFGIGRTCRAPPDRPGELPAFHRIVAALGKAPFLFLLVAGQPVFEQQQAVRHQQLLERGRLRQERAHLILAGIAHHALHTGAVVPAAVEQHDLPGGGEVGDIALEVPLALFALGWLGQRHGAALAGLSRWSMAWITPVLPAVSRPSKISSARRSLPPSAMQVSSSCMGSSRSS